MHVESGYQRPYWKLVKLATGIPFNICQYGSENDKLLFHRWFLFWACNHWLPTAFGAGSENIIRSAFILLSSVNSAVYACY